MYFFLPRSEESSCTQRYAAAIEDIRLTGKFIGSTKTEQKVVLNKQCTFIAIISQKIFVITSKDFSSTKSFIDRQIMLGFNY
jgi:hypothetical protein